MVLAEKGVSEDKAKITRDSHVWVYLKPKFTAQQQSSYQLSVQSSYQLSVQLWGILQQLAATLRFVISYNNYQLLVTILDFISDVISDNFGWQLYKKIFRVYFQKNIVIMNCNKGRDCLQFTTQFTTQVQFGYGAKQPIH